MGSSNTQSIDPSHTTLLQFYTVDCKKNFSAAEYFASRMFLPWPIIFSHSGIYEKIDKKKNYVCIKSKNYLAI